MFEKIYELLKRGVVALESLASANAKMYELALKHRGEEPPVLGPVEKELVEPEMPLNEAEKVVEKAAEQAEDPFADTPAQPAPQQPEPAPQQPEPAPQPAPSGDWNPCDPASVQKAYRDTDKVDAIIAACEARGVKIAKSWSAKKKHEALLAHVAEFGQNVAPAPAQPEPAPQQAPAEDPFAGTMQPAPQQQAPVEDPFAMDTPEPNPADDPANDPFGPGTPASEPAPEVKEMGYEDALEVGKKLCTKLGAHDGKMRVRAILDEVGGGGKNLSEITGEQRYRFAQIVQQAL